LSLTAIAMTAPLILSPAHYVAVFAGIFYLRFLQSLARLHAWRPWDKPVGPALAVLLVGVLLVVLCDRLFSPIRARDEASQLTSGSDFSSKVLPSQGSSFASARRTVTQELQKQAGRQLVLVRYTPGHDPYQEWIYNRADIDASPIVWAHEMGAEQDRPFLEYFHDRRVWLLEPDRSPPKLSPYPSEVSP